MKRVIKLTVALALSTSVLFAAPALADEGEPLAGCQPGTEQSQGKNGIGEWQLMSQSEYADYLIETFGSEPYPGAAEDRAEITYDFCDKNGDDYACVLKQDFPTNAAGFSVSLLAEDNHYPNG
jgi:hypothetical protein